MTDANFIIAFFVTKGLIRGPKTAKTQLDTNLACLKIPGMCIFWKQKAPALCVAPNIEEGLRIHPNKINSFSKTSGKVGFPQKSRIWCKFIYQNSLFTENLNGPYGPYGPLLWDISRTKWPNNWVFGENSFFEKWPCPKFWEMLFLVEKKPLRGASTAKQRF